jgi:hypothetical protein
MVPRKRARGVASKRAAKAPRTELSAEAKTRKQQKLVKEIEQFGIAPRAPAQLFVVQGAQAFTLHEENLISLKKLPERQGACMDEMEEDKRAAAAARSKEGRRRLTINAGAPTSSNPSAGSCFHTTGFLPVDSETHERRWCEPKPLTFELAPHPYCSEADVLARYVGHRAIMGPDGASHFVIFFLNEGEAEIAPRPEDDGEEETEAWAKYRQQRDRIEANLRKLYLVYPERMHPVLEGDGSRQVKMGTALPSTDAHEVPFMVGCFASIRSDKREGQPGASSQFSIGGYHELCRVWPLSPKVLNKICRLMDHFEIDLPALRNPRAGTLQLDKYRAEEIAKIGPAPMQLTQELSLDPFWLAKRTDMPFAKPWVQECSFHDPDGAVHEDNGAPKMVPLYKGCAEERNGHCWLDPDALNQTTEHAERIQELLCNLVGRPHKPPPARTEAVVRELKETLSASRRETETWRTKFAALEKELDSVRNERAQLYNQHKKAEKVLNASSTSRFSLQQSSQVGYKVLFGGCDARVSILRKARGTLQLTKPNGEVLATWSDDGDHSDKLVLRFSRSALSGESDESA